MARDSLEIGNGETADHNVKPKRKLKAYIAGGVVLVVVIALIVTAIVLLTRSPGEAEDIGTTESLIQTTTQAPAETTTTPSLTTTIAPTTVTEDPGPEIEPISLGDISSLRALLSSFNATWVSGSELLFRSSETGDLLLRNVLTDSETVVLSAENPLLLAAIEQEFSPDRNYLSLAYNERRIYRHSFTAQYSCVNLQTSEVTPIGPVGNESASLELLVWAPLGNALAFVFQNNIYYKASVDSPAVQITTNGILGTVYNGVPDWVYEEEVFSSNKALWFSPSGTHIAYGTFDDTNTRIMTIPYYGRPGLVESQYTQHFNIRYPKVGTPNPVAGVVLVNLSGGTGLPSSTVLTPPAQYTEPILAAVSLPTENSVAVLWLNRIQNESVVVLCTDGQTSCTQIYEHSEPNGWVDLSPLIFNAAGDAFITIVPQAIGNDSWKQIVQVSQNATSGDLWTVSARTNTENTVQEILKWETDTDTIWYLATSPSDSAAQHVYRVDGSGDISCFTCDIEHSSGDLCLYNEGAVSTDSQLITVSCLGPNVPEVYIYNRDGTRRSVWQDNREASALVSARVLPRVTKLSVPLADGAAPAQVLLLTPANITSTSAPIPLLINVYGGPDSNSVLHRYNLDWGASLVSRWNIAVARIDGRGSGLRGTNNMFSLYRALGGQEVDDQIAVTRYLQENLGYIDRNRTCIWGWSYGGYASAKSLARGNDTYSCAISVAPVTDWLYYDTIYTERYMGLPTINDNAAGYAAASLNTVASAQALANKRFMLVHGTLDDNVHYQQSMMFSRLLQQNDIWFTQMTYSDENHALNGVQPHLYHSLEKFLHETMF